MIYTIYIHDLYRIAMYVLPHLQILLVHILQYHLHKHFYPYIKVMFYMTKVINIYNKE